MRTAIHILTDPTEQVELLDRLRGGQEIRVDFDNEKPITIALVRRLLRECPATSEAGSHNLKLIGSRSGKETIWGGYNRYQFIIPENISRARMLFKELARKGHISVLELLMSTDGGD